MITANPGGTVCIGADIDTLDLGRIAPSSVVTIRPDGPPLSRRIGTLICNPACNRLAFENLRFGGTPTARRPANAVFICCSVTTSLRFTGVDVGWTSQDQAADEGYGFRIYAGGGSNRIGGLVIERSRIHHTNCDAMQFDVSGAVVDRNEISYIASLPGLDCHADSIQCMTCDGGSRFTGNYFHHIGYVDESHNPAPSYPGGQWIWHDWGGVRNTGGALVENNLMRECRNYCIAWGRGLSNVTLRRNTIIRGGTAFGSTAPSTNWNGSAPAGGGNLVDSNIIDRRSHHAGVTEQNNVWINQAGSGSNIQHPVTFDANYSPTNLPSYHAGAGYRKPSGAPW